jgi:hypothetical protein
MAGERRPWLGRRAWWVPGYMRIQARIDLGFAIFWLAFAPVALLLFRRWELPVLMLLMGCLSLAAWLHHRRQAPGESREERST